MSIPERGLRPASELFAGRDHGTRGRYLAGCKCFYCRRANSDYERERKKERLAGRPNSIISARQSRQHVKALQRAGIGLRTIAKLSGVARSILQEIANGKRPNVRAQTERKLLAVTDIEANAAPKALVDGADTWQIVEKLVDEGFTKRAIAAELGISPKNLAPRKRVTAARAKAVRAIARKYALHITEG